MPRRSAAPRSSVASTANDLLRAVSNLTGAVAQAMNVPQVREARASVRSSARAVAKVAGEKGAKLKKSLKAAWAKLTPARHKGRGKKTFAGRGQKAKAKKTPTAKGLRLEKASKTSWARMTPEQRAERIAKMQKGRGLKPKTKPAA
jgi:hypothetical protein